MSEKNHENRENLTAIRKRLLRYLTANNNITELSKEFGGLSRNFERVDFVLELLKTSPIRIDLIKDGKSDELAVKMREKGNEMFKIKKIKEAWEFYTKSIKYAEENSVNLALAYANRSAVLFEVNLHKQCLMDIHRAMENNYPEHLKSKLFVREKNSKNLEIEAFKNPYETAPFINNKNSKIQCASDCIEICENDDLGRHVIATRDIKAGEIVAVEKPFALLLVDHFLNHCHECLSLCYNLIPCKSCTQALYCNESCRERAFDTYHKYECCILATIKALDVDKLKLLPLKIALLVCDDFDEHQCESSIEEEYRSDRYREIHNLITNTSKRSIPDLFERAIAAAILFNLVKNHTDFFINSNNELERNFKDILLLHMQTGPSNFHEIIELVQKPSGTFEPEEIASGAFAFLSLLNHSCCPNVSRFCYGSTVVLRAIENIKKGEQCFDNYGYHYALMSKNERRNQLKNQYHFDCTCVACENDWPLYDALPSINNTEIDEELFSKLSLADVEVVDTVLEDALLKLSELQEMKPSKNFCKIQEVVKQCFAVLGNKRRIF